jgi:hypothetical protein
MSIISRESEKTIETKAFKMHYNFLTGRHSGSFFLKIGAAIFWMGKIIHNCIMLARNLMGYTDDDGEQSLTFLELLIDYNQVLNHLQNFVFLLWPLSNALFNVSMQRFNFT